MGHLLNALPASWGTQHATAFTLSFVPHVLCHNGPVFSMAFVICQPALGVNPCKPVNLIIYYHHFPTVAAAHVCDSSQICFEWMDHMIWLEEHSACQTSTKGRRNLVCSLVLFPQTWYGVSCPLCGYIIRTLSFGRMEWFSAVLVYPVSLLLCICT